MTTEVLLVKSLKRAVDLYDEHVDVCTHSGWECPTLARLNALIGDIHDELEQETWADGAGANPEHVARIRRLLGL